MKTLLPFVVLALCIYYYWETHKTEAPPAEPVAVMAPTPVPRKLYYHSPLDAPAMPANSHTGVGYYSSDPSSVWKAPTVADGTAPRSEVPGKH